MPKEEKILPLSSATWFLSMCGVCWGLGQLFRSPRRALVSASTGSRGALEGAGSRGMFPRVMESGSLYPGKLRIGQGRAHKGTPKCKLGVQSPAGGLSTQQQLVSDNLVLGHTAGLACGPCLAFHGGNSVIWSLSMYLQHSEPPWAPVLPWHRNTEKNRNSSFAAPQPRCSGMFGQGGH